MGIDEIFEIVKHEKIKFIRLQFSDINGVLKNVEIPSNDLKRAFDKGIMFDGSSIEGFVRINESDMYLKPDPSTFAILPWTLEGQKSARIICDVYKHDGTPFEGDPRYRLKRVMNEAKEMGFIPHTGPEVEFFLLPRRDNRPVFEFLDEGGYFDLLPVDIAEHLRSEVAVMLEEMGIDVEATHHEVAPSQHEVDFRYSNALSSADAVQTVKLVIKTLAVKNELYATFMPKPFFGVNGSGMHVHLSLLTEDLKDNAFYDKEKDDISDTMRYFIGGLIKYARPITAITNPTVNSYKRLVPGYEAPVNVAWSLANRSALIRVPMARQMGTRLEYRAPDPSCNPYLAFSVLIKAGLEGIRKKIEPPMPVEKNIYRMDEEEKGNFGIKVLPENLKEAIDEMEKCDLIKEALGEHIFAKFIKMKRNEWKEYSMLVTEWERKRYEII
ncbi:glutamine synthetase [Thermosipho melanesiensis]|uniref:Glutamine synthetase n=2 Tax=Thermosipho melanesiensis TaxID=46541 RepID=A6LLQ0_THEM4|nr:glutamine synthetase family protein [Thermosipho melanesiensis]ABR30851.1 glutamine synthetase, type I [Thermosipho melanesiensis BI429]APT73970.1 glutamine synthetase [Thermosipho melanesiensis]OOC35905.1 glutamine synthetase [Thermosipho melanesiensis]OOC38407.1 glutamine synthetase [Thermosipho melanesiensis]OOC38868.1 glutamine synthetase [Thermosipho melanesiensis]